MQPRAPWGLVYRIAGLLGRNQLAAAAIVGLNPLVLVWGLGGDHNDFIMVFLLTLAFYLLLTAQGAPARRVVGRATGDAVAGDPRPADASLGAARQAWPRPLSAAESLGRGSGLALAWRSPLP